MFRSGRTRRHHRQTFYDAPVRRGGQGRQASRRISRPRNVVFRRRENVEFDFRRRRFRKSAAQFHQRRFGANVIKEIFVAATK
jgi:hypothetical protein